MWGCGHLFLVSFFLHLSLASCYHAPELQKARENFLTFIETFLKKIVLMVLFNFNLCKSLSEMRL